MFIKAAKPTFFWRKMTLKEIVTLDEKGEKVENTY